MNSSNAPLRLDVSQLNLTLEHPDYDDAIACVLMYQRQAVLLSLQDQREMIRDIVAKLYVVTKSSRAGITHHRMYRAAMRNDRRNTKSAYFILSALYHKVAKPYQDIVQRKFGSTAVEDRLGSYLAFYPNTVVQNQADTIGEHAARFKTDYPNVRNIPYWVRMGLPEPDIVNCRPLGADLVQSEESAAFHGQENQEAHLGAAATDDMASNSQDDAIFQGVTNTAAQCHELESSGIDFEQEPEDADAEMLPSRFRIQESTKRKRPEKAEENSKRVRFDESRLAEDVDSQQKQLAPPENLSLFRNETSQSPPITPLSACSSSVVGHHDMLPNATNHAIASLLHMDTPVVSTSRNTDSTRLISSNNVTSNTTKSCHTSLNAATLNKNAVSSLPLLPIEARSSNTPSPVAPPTQPSASQSELSVNDILRMVTKNESPSRGDSSRSASQMQPIMQSIARLEEKSEDFAAFKNEAWQAISAMAAAISDINKRLQ